MLHTIKDIAWVAGFLEGEGYFGINKGSPRIYVNQTDKDTVEKLRNIISPSSKIGFQDRIGNRQRIYRFWIYGDLAASWMMTIYSMMSIRRKSDIQEVLRIWRGNNGGVEFKLAQIYSKAKGITVKEALKYTSKMLVPHD